ncbi:hypothetical protein DSOUD_0086 [Desulfuromonas soudanensis]|uniref:V-type ATP synthase subunit C n=1 Tax=Desulfuromonas soudanensis TaxID=1603606 RepID=A0A0M4DED1_9BACT|nr:V-type ATPase subunit [Desulfuromonas soudanensis]ALC14887.1 hypothetical protein DSOUD_0086 [Desulfuromonas soudanensis]
MPSIVPGLLKSAEDRCHPPDYLLARVRGRRARIAGDWSELLRTSPAGIGGAQEAFRGELAWLYGQMNRSLRSLFGSVFEFFELRTWLLALRYLSAGEEKALPGILAPSLLAPPIKALLLQSRDFAAVLAGSQKILAEADPDFSGLGALYRRQGPGGLEAGVIDLALRRALRLPLHPAVRTFFRELIDTRNLLGLYKHLQWQLSFPPPHLDGGRVTKKRLSALWRGRSIPPLMACARTLAGDPAAAGSLEKILLDGVSRSLRRGARDPLGPGVILDHLWFCHTRARNLELMARLGAGDEGRLEEELLS